MIENLPVVDFEIKSSGMLILTLTVAWAGHKVLNSRGRHARREITQDRRFFLGILCGWTLWDLGDLLAGLWISALLDVWVLLLIWVVIFLPIRVNQQAKKPKSPKI